MKRNLVSAFKPHGRGLAKLFGSLEAEIMERVWARGQVTARDIFEALRDQGQRISYGATKTVLDRLVKKQVLVRAMEGNQYLYQAVLERGEFERSAIREIVDALFSGFGAPVYAQFLDQVRHAQPEQLDQLTRMIDDAEGQAKAAEE